jgi:hypothetical protein
MIRDFNTEAVEQAINNGIKYLHEHQLPNGEFMCYCSPDDAMQQYCVPDSTVFPTSLIISCLLPLKDNEKVKAICSASVNFLTYQMMRGAVWNYFSRWNPLFKFLPADTDDTAYASFVLRSLNADFPDNRGVLLSNRNSKGLFYTWYITRNISQLFGKYKMVHLREFKYPINSMKFWFINEAQRNDIDPVVNANILNYLGYDNDTKSIVPFLLETLNKGQESERDKWYRDPIAFYYFFSRNYASVKELEPGREIIIDRIFKFFQEDGMVGNSILSSAMALTALVNLGHNDNRMEIMVNYLLTLQHNVGNWDRYIFYYSGPSKERGWGSEEITTAQCVEALHKYITRTSKS